MRVLIIYCHPNEKSFASEVHGTVRKALQDKGHIVTDLDLYAEEFKPVMSREERIKYEDPARYHESVDKYAAQLAKAEAIVANMVVRPACDVEGIFRQSLGTRHRI
jgi:NAD(P)H dehydrogenase (quinone)